MSGAPTQQQTSLTSPAGPVYTFSFHFVLMCIVIIDAVQQGDALTLWCSGFAVLSVVIVIIDAVQQGDAEMSHPHGQVSAVLLPCGVVGLLYCL